MGEHELLLPLVDEENACLPLPINAVSRYWNVTLPIAEAAQAAKKYAGSGSILIEGIESAERHGLACVVARPPIIQLKKTIEAGIPPIVILPGIPEITQHASVITGYSDEEGTMLHYVQKGDKEGEQQEGAIPQDVFEREWSEESNMAILVAPPEVMSSIQLNVSKADRMCLDAERCAALGDAQGAIKILQEAESLDPGNPTVHNALGGMLNGQGSPECVKHYEACIRANPRAYLAHNGLGNHYLKTGKFDDALKCYTQAIGIDPKRAAKIYKNRAYLLEKQGRNQEAKEDLQRYVRYYPAAPDRGVIEQAIREL